MIGEGRDLTRPECSRESPIGLRHLCRDAAGRSAGLLDFGDRAFRHGQISMREIMGVYLDRIKWDRGGMPVRLFPFTRDRYAESPQIISIDPRIRFGTPCISGTRIRTAISHRWLL
jgi:hypothetical protein